MLLQAFLFTLIPFAAAIASGVLASYWTPGPEARSYIQHFAAGVVLAAVAGELLPKVVESGQYVSAATIGFVAGLGVMLAIKLFSHAGEKQWRRSERGELERYGGLWTRWWTGS